MESGVNCYGERPPSVTQLLGSSITRLRDPFSPTILDKKRRFVLMNVLCTPYEIFVSFGVELEVGVRVSAPGDEQSSCPAIRGQKSIL